MALWAGSWWIVRFTLTPSWILELPRVVDPAETGSTLNQRFASTPPSAPETPNCVHLLDCHQLLCNVLISNKSLFILTTVATARWCSILSCNDNKYRNNVTLYLLPGIRRMLDAIKSDPPYFHLYMDINFEKEMALPPPFPPVQTFPNIQQFWTLAEPVRWKRRVQRYYWSSSCCVNQHVSKLLCQCNIVNVSNATYLQEMHAHF